MSSQTEQTTQGSVSADATMLQTPSNAGRSRLVFVDNLKVALIILVVLHHVAVIYAANTAFYYLEPAYHDTPALVVLVLFQLLNHAYFSCFQATLRLDPLIARGPMPSIKTACCVWASRWSSMCLCSVPLRASCSTSCPRPCCRRSNSD